MNSNAACSNFDLETQRKFVESVLDSAMIGFWDWNVNENSSYLSPALKQMLGYEDHELPNCPDTWLSLLVPEEIPRVAELMEQHLTSQGRIPFSCEIRFRHKNSFVVWVLCNASIIEWNKTGEPKRVVATQINITKHKETEQALALEQSNLQHKKIALTEVLSQLKDEKHNFKSQFHKNLEIAILPILSRLRKRENGIDRTLLNVLETSFVKISTELPGQHNRAPALSPKELQICKYLKKGMSAKEIAHTCDLSCRTVEKHRENIRNKLAIKGTSINLVSYLQNFNPD